MRVTPGDEGGHATRRRRREGARHAGSVAGAASLPVPAVGLGLGKKGRIGVDESGRATWRATWRGRPNAKEKERKPLTRISVRCGRRRHAPSTASLRGRLAWGRRRKGTGAVRPAWRWAGRLLHPDALEKKRHTGQAK